jgi:hypothetical protein
MVIVAPPSFCIDLVSGLLGGASVPPFFFRAVGLTQYFSKIPSQSHCTRDRVREAANMALSAIDWYSLNGRSAGCFCFRVGKGLFAPRREGKTSSATEAEGDEREAGL